MFEDVSGVIVSVLLLLFTLLLRVANMLIAAHRINVIIENYVTALKKTFESFTFFTVSIQTLSSA